MTWVRIDEEFPEHPKLSQVGAVGMALQVAALAYCNRNLTDGFVPFGIAETLISFSVSDSDGRRWQLARTSGTSGEDVTARWVIGLMLGAGIWEDAPGGYLIHDFGQYQPPRQAVIAEREASRERQRKARANRAANGGSAAEVTDGVAETSRRDTPRSSSTAVAVTESVTETKGKGKGHAATNAATPAHRDLIFEALCEIEGVDWHRANERELGRITKARGLAKQSAATPDEIKRASGNWGDVMGDATRTALGVMSNLQLLLKGQPASRQTRDRAREAAERAMRRPG